jgi:hypothetical protein
VREHGVVVVWHEGAWDSGGGGGGGRMWVYISKWKTKKLALIFFWSFHLGSCRRPWDRRWRWSGVKEQAVGWLWLWFWAGGGISVSWMSVKILIAPFFGWVVLGAIIDAHGPCAFLGCYTGRLSTGEGAGRSR